MTFLTTGGFGGRLTPLASPVTRFTFDDNYRPLTKQSSLRKPSLGSNNNSPSKNRKHVSFGQASSKIFCPLAQLYHLDSWPAYLRLLSPAHLLFLFITSLLMAIGGCVAYPLGSRITASLMWLVSGLLVSVLMVLGITIIVKKGGQGGFGKILTSV